MFMPNPRAAADHCSALSIKYLCGFIVCLPLGACSRRTSLTFVVRPLPHAMRAFIIFVLSCASVLGGDTGIQVVSTVKTNAETGRVYLTDVFTRGGQTNLVRRTNTKAGVVQIRMHRFYHRGVLIGDYIATTDSSGFTTEAGTPYSVSFEFWPSKEVRMAVIGTKDGVIVDAFACTNGMFSPVESPEIARANAVTHELSHLLAPSRVRNTTPEDFGREVERFIRKHQE